MAAHNISKDRWPHYLTSQLTGKAQLAFAAVSPSDSGNYEKIKAAILIRYGINDEEYRRRFRSERRKDGETNRQLAVRLMEWQAKWLKECQTVEDVLNAVGKEQFLNTLPTDKKLWVLERKPETCVKAGELADEYEQARRPEMETLASSTSKPNRVGSRECHYCGKSGHTEEDCYKRKREESQRSRGTQCYHCKKQGHMSWECPEKSMVCKERRETGDVKVADQCTRRARWRDKRSQTFFLTRVVREQWSVGIWLPWRRSLLEGSRQSPVHMETPNFIPLL